MSIDKSVVDAAFIPDVASNGITTVASALEGFYAWPKDQVIFDEKVHIYMHCWYFSVSLLTC